MEYSDDERPPIDDEAFLERVPNGTPPPPVPASRVALRKPGKTPAQRALTIGQFGPPIASEIPSVDTATRGGPRPGGIMVAGGAPGSGKTALMVHLVFTWAKRGVPVTVLASDQAADELLVRLGQQLGLDRDAIERGDATTLRSLSDSLARWPNLTIYDADDDEATVEDATRELLARAGGKPAVLAVDSIQTARAEGTTIAVADRRQEVDVVVKALKAAAKAGLLVVATSEVNRGGYRSKNPDDQVNDLAVFKESGGIEFAGHLLLVMRDREDLVVDVTMPKNRWGQKRPFRLVLNPERASVVEVSRPADVSPLEVNSETRLEMDVEVGRRVLRENPGVAGKDRLRALLKGISRNRSSEVIRVLEQAGEIVNLGTVKRPKLYLRGTEPPESPEPSRSLPEGCDTTTLRSLPTPIGGRPAGRVGAEGSDREGEP